jgi:hypothetical protein
MNGNTNSMNSAPDDKSRVNLRLVAGAGTHAVTAYVHFSDMDPCTPETSDPISVEEGQAVLERAYRGKDHMGG